ncbi:alanine racemase C-terminal domain-containing protein [Blautia difficilis]
MGYADGFWRSNWKKPYAILVNGKLSLITGHVCMEQMMVDVSNIECELERV